MATHAVAVEHNASRKELARALARLAMVADETRPVLLNVANPH